MTKLAPLFATGIVLLGGTGHATQIAQVSTDFNFIGVHGNDGRLSSTLDCGITGLCTVFDRLEFYQPHDGQVNLVWTRADGSILLDGQVPYSFSLGGGLNTDIGRESSVGYKGFLQKNPPFQQLQGTADFTGSVTINPPCFGFVCKEDYLELLVNIPDVFGGSPSGGGQQLTRSAAAANPELSITWTLSNLSVPSFSPFPTEPTTNPVIEFSSTVEKLASGFGYSYTLTNLSDDPVAYAIDQLGWNGTLDAHGSLSQETLSSLPPGLVSNTGQADLGQGRKLGSSFDVLEPVAPHAVPEPQTLLLFGSSLAPGSLVLRRRRAGKPATASGPRV